MEAIHKVFYTFILPWCRTEWKT